jgi:hypothetical protein
MSSTHPPYLVITHIQKDLGTLIRVPVCFPLGKERERMNSWEKGKADQLNEMEAISEKIYWNSLTR